MLHELLAEAAAGAKIAPVLPADDLLNGGGRIDTAQLPPWVSPSSPERRGPFLSFSDVEGAPPNTSAQSWRSGIRRKTIRSYVPKSPVS